LGAGLYEELKKDFSETWGKLDPYFDSQFNINFEEGIQTMFSDGDYSIEFQRLMRDLAEYFCKFRAEEDSNLYVRLLKGLEDDANNTIFSTLNYDLLFEDALKQNGLNPNYCLGSSKGIIFLKLHGSCNFVPPWLRFYNVALTGDNIIKANMRSVDRDNVISFCHSGRSDYPIMCMYMKEKPTQVGGNEIKAIQAKWAEYVRNAEKLLIIGVRPFMDDSHIWEPL
jgi:hypothetical protein